MKRALFLPAILIIFLASDLVAAIISGRVISHDGGPIEGVNVQTDIATIFAITDRNGDFMLDTGERLPTRLTFSHVSYQSQLISLGKDKKMTDLEILLDPAVYPGQNIKVTAMRAQAGKTPVAFSDFTNKDIERDYTLDDFPILLDMTPNMYSFSYTGGIGGASDYKIRGFDSKRIGVYINGIPLNDPEDQTTYFYDMPDFAAEVTDIQVQRGVGNSLYGDASFGGSINISSAGLDRDRKITLTSGYGQFLADGDFVSEMRKSSVEYSSGLIDGRWSLGARYSKLHSGGYRENAWYDGWAYFLSVSRLDPNMATTINVYGGPIRAHLAFSGIDRETIKTDRRFNPSTYRDEVDDFSQPHYELHNAYRIKENLTFNNTLYYIRGIGYYEGYKYGKAYYDYNIPESVVVDTSIKEIDLVRQKWVAKNQYGWNPRLEWEHKNGTAAFGGAFYYFNSDHWGQITWAQNVRLQPLYHYYEDFGKKYSASVYALENYMITEKISLMGNLQLRYLKYDFDMPRNGVFIGYKYNLDWLFLSPRVGMTYLFNDRMSAFASFSISSREPDDASIFDADYPYAKPALRNGKVIADAERVYDFEVGGNWRGEKHKIGINLYWMDFRNEIVQAVGIDDDGLPLLRNADRSVHAGVETEASYRPIDYLSLSGNFSFGLNRLKDYVIYNDTDWTGTIDDTADFSDNPIPGFPVYLGNLLVDFKRDHFRFTLRSRFVGKQYVDNEGTKSIAIDDYFISDLSASVALGRLADLGLLTLSGRINNLFNKKYELTAVMDAGTAYYIPAAERNFFVQLKWELQ